MKTNREIALEWWESLTTYEKHELGISTGDLRNYNGVTWQNFTGREIEDIWEQEYNYHNNK
jgi:hypothetical protein